MERQIRNTDPRLYASSARTPMKNKPGARSSQDGETELMDGWVRRRSDITESLSKCFQGDETTANKRQDSETFTCLCHRDRPVVSGDPVLYNIWPFHEHPLWTSVRFVLDRAYADHEQGAGFIFLVQLSSGEELGNSKFWRFLTLNRGNQTTFRESPPVTVPQGHPCCISDTSRDHRNEWTKLIFLLFASTLLK